MWIHLLSLRLIDGAGGQKEEPPKGGYSTGNAYLRQKLLKEFESEEKRLEALKNLPRIDEKQRAAIKVAASALAKSADGFEFDDVESQIKAALYPLGEQPNEIHLDWTLYFLRVEAFKAARAEAQAEEEMEAVIALMMAKRMYS